MCQPESPNSRSKPTVGRDSVQLTHVLRHAANGNQRAQDKFCRMVYSELREAARMLLWDGQRASFQPSALVNELFLRVFDRDMLRNCQNRRYFFTAAVDQMRKILIDHHRRKATQRHGGTHKRLPMDDVLDQVLSELQKQTKCDLENLENSLESLAERHPRQAEVVRLRFYGGLSHGQIADLLEVSVSTVERDWRVARAKLYAELRGDEK